MVQTTEPDIDIDEIMRKIRDEVAKRRGMKPQDSTTINAPNTLAADLMSSAQPSLRQFTLQPNFESKAGGYCIDDFTRYHHTHLVRAVYRGVLCREPDSEGWQHFLQRLEKGESKISILGRIRYSAEGRKRGVLIRGLAMRFAAERACQIPIIGYLLQLAVVLARLPRIVQHGRRSENYTAARLVELVDHVEELYGNLQNGLNGNHAQIEAALREVGLIRDKVEGHFIAAAKAMELKADSERLEDILRELRRIRNEVEDRVVPVEKALELKTDSARLEDVLPEFRRIRNELEGRLVAVEKALGLKADSEHLTNLANHLLDSLKSRPEKSNLDALADRLEAATRSVDASLTELRSVVVTQAAGASGTTSVLREQVLDLRRSLLDQQRRVQQLVDEVRNKLTNAPSGGQLHALIAEDEHLLDAFYVSFEDRFRGTREDIKQRVEIYLPVVHEAGAGTAEAPILDIGCGRGDWLELLKENGHAARGVDLNRVVVAQCSERGLDVIEGDAVEYLRSLTAGSLGAVTGMHVIEHVPFRRLVVLLDEVFRALRSGGVAIFETPNPENLIVGACNFYYDPTHERPLPPEPLRFIAEARGFERVEILRLHPFPERFLLTEGAPAVRDRINDVLYGAQDYAVVAYRP